MSRWLFIPVLLLLVLLRPSRAQTPAATPAAAEPTQALSSSPAETPAKGASPKKVWTNDNLSGAGGKVSVVGDKHNQKYSAAPAKSADPGTISRIRENLQKLQMQLEDVNLQLSSLREFQQGETVSLSSEEIRPGYTRVPVNQQIPVLQEKKKKLQLQIDELLDEARKKGIEPGQLR